MMRMSNSRLARMIRLDHPGIALFAYTDDKLVAIYEGTFYIEVVRLKLAWSDFISHLKEAFGFV